MYQSCRDFIMGPTTLSDCYRYLLRLLRRWRGIFWRFRSRRWRCRSYRFRNGIHTAALVLPISSTASALALLHVWSLSEPILVILIRIIREIGDPSRTRLPQIKEEVCANNGKDGNYEKNVEAAWDGHASILLGVSNVREGSHI